MKNGRARRGVRNFKTLAISRSYEQQQSIFTCRRTNVPHRGVLRSARRNNRERGCRGEKVESRVSPVSALPTGLFKIIMRQRARARVKEASHHDHHQSGQTLDNSSVQAAPTLPLPPSCSCSTPGIFTERFTLRPVPSNP